MVSLDSDKVRSHAESRVDIELRPGHACLNLQRAEMTKEKETRWLPPLNLVPHHTAALGLEEKG